jgi:ATP-dependent Clp protease ATP-binding subunit ClpA
MSMPKINIYLSDELAQAVKEAGIPVSTVCQRALEQAVRRVTAVHETIRADDLGSAFEHLGKLTGRVRVLVTMAVEAARAEGHAVGTVDLLAALIEEGDGLGLRVLRAIEIDPQELAGGLRGRTEGAGTGFSAQAQEALRLAATESSAFGHSFIGTEHILLGLIAEPEGVAGQLLRGAGADLRLTRRAVRAALVGWYAHNEANPISDLSDAIREQLDPIVARLERLESQVSP